MNDVKVISHVIETQVTVRLDVVETPWGVFNRATIEDDSEPGCHVPGSGMVVTLMRGRDRALGAALQELGRRFLDAR